MTRRFLPASALGALIGAMIVFPGEAATAARDTLGAWAQAVVPGLGPFMACVLLLSPYLRGGMPSRVALAWLGGSPGGARLMQETALSPQDALHYAALTGTMSPMFFLSTLGGWLGNARAGWMLLCCHIAGAFLAGRCFPLSEKRQPSPPSKKERASVSSVFQDTAAALSMIGVCMMLGAVAARMAACAMPFWSPGWMAAFQCLLEVTAGSKALIALAPAELLPLLCAACSMGGLSILLQNFAFWHGSGLSLPRLLLVRILHALIAGSLCLLLTRVL